MALVAGNRAAGLRVPRSPSLPALWSLHGSALDWRLLGAPSLPLPAVLTSGQGSGRSAASAPWPHVTVQGVPALQTIEEQGPA